MFVYIILIKVSIFSMSSSNIGGISNNSFTLQVKE